MDEPGIYSSDDISSTYNQIYDLLITQFIIRKYSTNSDDIRAVALEGLDLSGCQRVLELGCGYGFFVENLKGLLDTNAVIRGIDLVVNNREAYLNSISSINYSGEFICDDVSIINTYEHSAYDLIISSYSLYFFPHLMKEIARILKPEGVFLVITHSRFSLQEVLDYLPDCLNKTGINNLNGSCLKRLFSAFSSENGSSQIIRYFDEYNYIPYKNVLLFPGQQIDDCLYYLQKKKHLLYKGIEDNYPEKVNELEKCIEDKVYRFAREKGYFALTKMDSVFQCYKPKL